MRRILAWTFGGAAALLVGCGGPSCPDGFDEVDGVCVVPGADTGVVDRPDGASLLDGALEPADDSAIDAAGADTGPRPDVGRGAPAAPWRRGDGGADAPLPDAFVEGCTTAPFYVDSDGDGFGNPGLRTDACGETLAGYSRDATDCDDGCASCYPGGTEICDGLDQDCSGAADEGLLSVFHADCDRDGYVVAGAMTVTACTPPAAGPAACPSGAWLASPPAQLDCDDGCMTCRPGGTEVCDGLDQDCVLGIDNGVLLTFYTDCDGDTFTPTGAITTMACSVPSTRPPGCPSGAWLSSASAMLDCFDTNANVRPNQTAYFTSSSGRPTLAYDYNCDGAESRFYTATSGTCPASVPMPMACGREGYEASTAPACGGSANYITCTRGTCVAGNCICNRGMGALPQECR